MKSALLVFFGMGAGLVHCSVRDVPDPGAMAPGSDTGADASAPLEGGTAPLPPPPANGSRIAGEDCASDVECVGSLACVAGVCEARFAGDTGKPCNVAADCSSGLCLPVAGGRVCSTTCAETKDCVPGWSCGQGGSCGCTVSNETCNGRDDNCDGVVDNVTATTAECRSSDPSAGEVGSPSGRACIEGACRCPAANRCGEACFDLNVASKHCGTCDNACGAGKACAAGTCICGGGETSCGGSCLVDFTRRNCGGCDKVCALGSPCTLGGCREIQTMVGRGGTKCIIVEGGSLRCWGNDNYGGQLGDGTDQPHARPLPVPGITVAKVDTSDSTTCAVLVGGSVSCWGSGNMAELGDGFFDISQDHYRRSPGAVPGVTGAVDIQSNAASGLVQFCALLGNGQVMCWGGNNGLYDPTVIQEVEGVTKLAGGGYGWCGLRADHTVVCFGPGQGAGGIGDGLANVKDIRGGGRLLCAIMTDKTVRCWGYGYIGDGTLSSTSPSVVTGLANVETLDVSEGRSCAVLTDKTVKCWGTDPGNGLADPQPAPVTVSNLANVEQVADGCAVLTDKTVKCWGRNDYGQLGDGGTAGRALSAVAVPNLTNVTAIYAGSSIHCVTFESGGMSCWGLANGDGVGYGVRPVGPLGFD